MHNRVHKGGFLLAKLSEARACVTEVGWLSRQPPAFRDCLLELCTLRAFGPGETLYGLDGPPGGLYGLTEGFADVLLAGGPAPPFLAFIGGPGWWVGEAAAMTGTTRRADIRARTAVMAFYLPSAELRKLTVRDPAVLRHLQQLTVQHLDNALMLASTLTMSNLRDRVISTLYRIAGAYRDVDTLIELPCKQSEIAEMAGLTRNSVGPVMRALAGEGLVRTGRGRVTFNPVELGRALGL